MRTFFARCISRFRTKRSAVEAGLRLLIQVHQQSDIRKLRGKVEWSGSLAESRLGRIAEPPLSYTGGEDQKERDGHRG